MKKSKQFISLILSIVMLISVTAGIDLSVYAANYDSVSKAKEIYIGTKYSGTISYDDEIDYYKFSLPSSSSLTINVNGIIAGIRLCVYDGNGKEIAKNQHRCSSSGMLSFSRTVPLTKGIYYLAAERSDYNGNGRREDEEYGEYSLMLTANSANESFTESGDGNNNLISTANEIVLNTQYYGQIAFNDYIDYYKFTLPSPSTVSINVRGNIGAVYVDIYSSLGEEIESYEAKDNDTGVISDNKSIVLTKGDYYIRFSKSDYYHNGVFDDRECGNYNFDITAISSNETFEETGNGNNNSISTANEVALNTQYYGQIALNDYIDYYKFTLPTNSTVLIIIKGTIGAVCVDLYSSQGEEILNYEATDNDAGVISNKKSIALTEGDYYIKFSKSDYHHNGVFDDRECGNYSFNIHTHTYTATTNKATLIKNGKIITKCNLCGDTKSQSTIYYPKTITLSATSYTYNGKVQKPTVTVKDSKGKTLKNGTDYTVSYASGCKNTGKYAVKITFKGNYSGTKTLYFNILPSKTTKLSASQTTTSIKATWKAVTGATGYKVTLYNSKGKAVKTVYTTKTTASFTKLSKGTTYNVRVTAYKTIDGKKVSSSVYTQITTATKPGTPSLKVTAGTKKASLSWNKQTGTSGYVVYMATSKNGTYKKIATVKGGTKVSYTKTGLTKGKTYYFKVRAYVTPDSKTTVYGDYSAVKSAKIK